jgi:hypothetical protein
MTYQRSTPVSFSAEPNRSADLVKLIRKLRWIGLEDEAHQLEIAVNQFPPETRATVVGNTSNTD